MSHLAFFHLVRSKYNQNFIIKTWNSTNNFWSTKISLIQMNHSWIMNVWKIYAIENFSNHFTYHRFKFSSVEMTTVFVFFFYSFLLNFNILNSIAYWKRLIEWKLINIFIPFHYISIISNKNTFLPIVFSILWWRRTNSTSGVPWRQGEAEYKMWSSSEAYRYKTVFNRHPMPLQQWFEWRFFCFALPPTINSAISATSFAWEIDWRCDSTIGNHVSVKFREEELPTAYRCHFTRL